MEAKDYRKYFACSVLRKSQRLTGFLPHEDCPRCLYNPDNIPGYTSNDAEFAELYDKMNARRVFQDANIIGTLKQGRRAR